MDSRLLIRRQRPRRYTHHPPPRYPAITLDEGLQLATLW